jgi:hypothetical protein
VDGIREAADNGRASTHTDLIVTTHNTPERT